MRPNVLLLYCFIFPFFLHAQPSGSNIYLFDYKESSTHEFTFTNCQLLTQFNNKNYNNQPSFLFNNLFISSDNGNGQTDILKLDLEKKEKVYVTMSAGSEYSPTPTPDGKHISVVRVSALNPEVQQLVKIPLDGSTEPKIILPDIKNVGYHLWLDNSRVVLFLVGEPHLLKLYNIKEGTSRLIKRGIGRCFKISPEGKITFLDKGSDDWAIKEVILKENKIRTIVQSATDSEDFIWTDSGTLLMGKGSKLLAYNIEEDDGWKEVADFAKFGIKEISRIDLSDAKIAIVSSN